jgi:hypothetical protein
MAQVGDIVRPKALQTTTNSLEGRPSTIQKYCLAAIDKGHVQCLWLCMRRRGRMLARDIPLASKNKCFVTLIDVRKQFGWWKRYSLYSAKGIEEVMVSGIVNPSVRRANSGRFASSISTKSQATLKSLRCPSIIRVQLENLTAAYRRPGILRWILTSA